MDEATDIGSQADPKLMAELHEQVQASVEAGATVQTGGEPLDREGAFYPPTVLTDVPEGCPADAEETFGPGGRRLRGWQRGRGYRPRQDTRFGLGASLWTEDRDRGERLARDVDAGCVYINEMTKSDPRVPFGGVGDAGYGRELSEAGIKEFVNRKNGGYSKRRLVGADGSLCRRYRGA